MRDPARALQEQSERYAAQAREIQRLKQREQERQQKALVDATVDLYARVYDRALLYTNAVLAGGYAALFAAWGLTARHMEVRLWLLAGLLALVSVGFFVGWEVFKGILTGRRAAALSKAAAADPGRAQELLGEYERRVARSDVTTFRAWAVVITVALVTGFGSFLIVVGSLAAALLGALLEVLDRGVRA